MATPEAPTPPTTPTPTPTPSPTTSVSSATSTSSGSSDRSGNSIRSCTSSKRQRDTVVQEAVSALVRAAELYKNQNAEALSKGENYDGLVKVELPGDGWLPIDQLGEACQVAKRSVGKLRVLAYKTTGEIFVRQVASGYTHAEAVAEVLGEIRTAVLPYSRRPERFVATGTDGMYGNAFISAPDVTVRSLGQASGLPVKDSEYGPLFFAEVEDGNRSLPELIRHLGMLLANYPNLNGVLGIKGEEDVHGHQMTSLITMEWRIAAGVRQPHVTNLVDFGPTALSVTRRNNANETLTLPLPAEGMKAIAKVHGPGAAVPLPVWTRSTRGRDSQGGSVIIDIPPTQLLGGAHSIAGVICDIPANAVPASINLEALVDIYFGEE